MNRRDNQRDADDIALIADSQAVVQAVTRLEGRLRSRASADAVASSLGLLEESLYALARCCRHAGDALIPPGDPRETLAERFDRAAAHRPLAAAETRAQQARILVALADARAALETAAALSHTAHQLIRSGATVPDRIVDERYLLAAPA
jgi:hypothetical protein